MSDKLDLDPADDDLFTIYLSRTEDPSTYDAEVTRLAGHSMQDVEHYTDVLYAPPLREAFTPDNLVLQGATLVEVGASFGADADLTEAMALASD